MQLITANTETPAEDGFEDNKYEQRAGMRKQGQEAEKDLEEKKKTDRRVVGERGVCAGEGGRKMGRKQNKTGI